MLEVAERQDRERVLVQRRRTDHEADALALELLDLGHAAILGDPERGGVAVDGRQHQLQGLRTPFLGAEFEHAFLGEIGAGAHRGHGRALGAQRRQSRHVIAGRQHADVGTVFVLHHLADADGDVEARRSGVIGGDDHGRRQLDVFGIGRRGQQRDACKGNWRERLQPTNHIFSLR